MALHLHSDNAPSHFKCSKTMYFLSKLPERLKSWVSNRPFRVVWEFGPPGHGKGVWDGIGAWMKRTVRQDIVDHRPPSMPTRLTDDGIILSPEYVFDHLKVSLCASTQAPMCMPCSPCACLAAHVHASLAVCSVISAFSHQPFSLEP